MRTRTLRSRIVKSEQAKDLREHGRVILAHGEVTGHSHQVVGGHLLTEGLVGPDGRPVITYEDPSDLDPAEREIPASDFFEEPDGRRVLLCHRACLLMHQEHAPIALNPANPQAFRQGDVFGLPIGDGAWEIRRQAEHTPEAIRSVAD